jgi:hypothetical protein
MVQLRLMSFPNGSFWQISLMRRNGATGIPTVLSSRLSMNRPDRQAVHDAINSLNDGVVSDKDNGGSGRVMQRFDGNTFMRIDVYNPGTGSGGELPAHLEGKKKCVWSPAGLHCAPKAIVVCLARLKKDNRASDHLKRKNGANKAMATAIKPLLEAVGEESWGYDEIYQAAGILGCDVMVLDSVTLVELYSTKAQDKRVKAQAAEEAGDESESESDEEEEDEEDQALFDLCFDPLPEKPQVTLLKWKEHFIACTNVQGLARSSNK